MPLFPRPYRSGRVGRVAAGLAIAIAVSALGAVRAQTPTARAPVVIAEYLVRFVKFVDWPADVVSPDGPLTICVADREVLDALSHAVARRPPGNRPITVVHVPAGAPPPECALLYVARMDNRQTAAVIAALRGRSVLSVSITEDFARRGGTIELFVADDGSMKFSVNPQAAERAHLRVSALLLNLARIVSE